jgi:hypothetical protein
MAQFTCFPQDFTCCWRISHQVKQGEFFSLRFPENPSEYVTDP